MENNEKVVSDKEQDLIDKCCTEYGENYSNLLSAENSNLEPLLEKVIKISHNLDTLKAHFESLQGDCELITSKTIPSIQSQLSQLQPIFDYIDNIEELVAEKFRILEDYEARVALLDGPKSGLPGEPIDPSCSDGDIVDIGTEVSGDRETHTEPSTAGVMNTSAIFKNLTDLFK